MIKIKVQSQNEVTIKVKTGIGVNYQAEIPRCCERQPLAVKDNPVGTNHGVGEESSYSRGRVSTQNM